MHFFFVGDAIIQGADLEERPFFEGADIERRTRVAKEEGKHDEGIDVLVDHGARLLF